MRIGDGGRLFGILHQPATGQPAYCVIMLNAGMQNRAGPHRLYWSFAQRAAGQRCGRRCAILRLDLPGAGDSAADNPATHFDAHDKADVALAVRFVRERWPAVPVILLGLCAGSRVAFKAAASDPDIQGVIAWSTTIITAAQNSPQSPYEPEDRLSPFVVTQQSRAMLRFITRLRFLSPAWWRRKLHNSRGLRSEVGMKVRVLKRWLAGNPADASKNEFLDSVETYLTDGRRVLFVYGDRDVRPLEEFIERFPQVPEADAGLQRMCRIPYGNHTFSSINAKTRVIDRTCAWLDEHFGERLG